MPAARSPFSLFAADARPVVLKQLVNKDAPGPEIERILGIKWSKLRPDEQAVYKKRAAANRAASKAKSVKSRNAGKSAAHITERIVEMFVKLSPTEMANLIGLASAKLKSALARAAAAPARAPGKPAAAALASTAKPKPSTRKANKPSKGIKKRIKSRKHAPKSKPKAAGAPKAKQATHTTTFTVTHTTS